MQAKDKIYNENTSISDEKKSKIDSIITSEEKIDYKKLIENNSEYKSNGFNFTVSKPSEKGYYYAQKFKENNHLGDDWDGNSGGNSDLGDVIYSVANGYSGEVKDYDGDWGNLLRIVHINTNELYEFLYAHYDKILTSEKRFIKKREQIAILGNCNGTYLTHLHLEIRNNVSLPIRTYSTDTTG